MHTLQGSACVTGQLKPNQGVTDMVFLSQSCTRAKGEGDFDNTGFSRYRGFCQEASVNASTGGHEVEVRGLFTG